MFVPMFDSWTDAVERKSKRSVADLRQILGNQSLLRP